MTDYIDVAEFGPRDVCEAAAARGENQLEAMDRFNAECIAAIRSDPELHAAWLHEAEMRQHAAENTPPSYDPAEMDAWVRSPREDEDREIGS